LLQEKNDVTIPPKPIRRRGRPTNLAAALHRIAELERELARLRASRDGAVNPRVVLEAIAIDPGAPPMARVAAARQLLKLDADAPEDDGVDALTRRALEMGGGHG
jgi:hypothetical protein